MVATRSNKSASKASRRPLAVQSNGGHSPDENRAEPVIQYSPQKSKAAAKAKALQLRDDIFRESSALKPALHDHAKHVSWLYLIAVWCCMIFVPLGVYWCWICVEYNQGRMLLPEAFTQKAFAAWWTSIQNRIVSEAFPSVRAWTVYLSWTLLQAVLFKYAPGPTGVGSLLEDGQTRLRYKYNGQFAFFTTIALVGALHYFDLFRLTELVTLYPQLLTVTILWCFIVIGALTLWAGATNQLERRTDSWSFDFFMGPMINPRPFGFDVKFFYELRPGIMHWFFTTLAFALKQYDETGVVSVPMALVCFYHLCFVNACYKGEQCVPHTIDIAYEKFGWMLMMLDIVMVPFIFPLQAYQVYKVPEMYSNYWYAFCGFMHVFGYYLFDTANSQKCYFRERDGMQTSKGFPKLPWGELSNPKYLQTERGTKLLCSGWWAWGRHMNYFGDMLMSWSWGLTVSTSTYFPYAYTTYLTPLLLHRERRDDSECQRKYGKDWDRYKELVPYRLCPYVY